MKQYIVTLIAVLFSVSIPLASAQEFNDEILSQTQRIKQECDDFRQTLADEGRIIISDDRLNPPRPTYSMNVITDTRGQIIFTSDKVSEVQSQSAAELYRRIKVPYPGRYTRGSDTLFPKFMPVYGCSFMEFEVNKKGQRKKRKELFSTPKEFDPQGLTKHGMYEAGKYFGFSKLRKTTLLEDVKKDENERIVWEYWSERLSPAQLERKCDELEKKFMNEWKIYSDERGITVPELISRPPRDVETSNFGAGCFFVEFRLDDRGRPYDMRLSYDSYLTDTDEQFGSSYMKYLILEEIMPAVRYLKYEPIEEVAETSGSASSSAKSGPYIRVNVVNRDSDRIYKKQEILKPIFKSDGVSEGSIQESNDTTE